MFIFGETLVLQSVKTALQVFEAVAMHQPIGVSDLSRQLKITKSTVQRCLVTLHEAGWLRPEGDRSTRWVITAKSFSLGRHAIQTSELRSAAVPAMARVRDVTDETVHLTVADGRETILVEEFETRQALRLTLPLGARAPLHATANGKSILAFFSEQELDKYLERELEAVTSLTIRDPQKLREQLESIRARGWAMAVDELFPGVSAVACPILDAAGRPIAAISISCPTNRFPESIREKYAHEVAEAAKSISRHLQHR